MYSFCTLPYCGSQVSVVPTSLLCLSVTSISVLPALLSLLPVAAQGTVGSGGGDSLELTARCRQPAWWRICAQWQVQTCSRIREQGSVCWVFRRCEAHVPFLRLRLRDEPPLSSPPALGNKSKPGRNRSLPAPFQPAAPGPSEQVGQKLWVGARTARLLTPTLPVTPPPPVFLHL